MSQNSQKTKRMLDIEKRLNGSYLKDMFTCVVGQVVGQTWGLALANRDAKKFEIAKKLVAQEFNKAGVFKENECELKEVLDKEGKLAGAFIEINLPPLIKDLEIDQRIKAGIKYTKEFHARGDNYHRVIRTIDELKKLEVNSLTVRV